MRGDVLLLVNLPDLVLSLIGDARIFGFLNFDSELFEFLGQKTRCLRCRVIFAAKVLFDVVVDVPIGNAGSELRASRFELYLYETAIRYTLDA